MHEFPEWTCVGSCFTFWIACFGVLVCLVKSSGNQKNCAGQVDFSSTCPTGQVENNVKPWVSKFHELMSVCEAWVSKFHELMTICQALGVQVSWIRVSLSGPGCQFHELMSICEFCFCEKWILNYMWYYICLSKMHRFVSFAIHLHLISVFLPWNSTPFMLLFQILKDSIVNTINKKNRNAYVSLCKPKHTKG